MLKGIKVVDFSRYLPGPFAGQRLADMGAEVVKIESPGCGDPARSMGGDGALLFQATNRNKKSVTLNLKEPEGRQAAFKLACKADVLIESFRPGVAAALGISYAELKRNNPGLIYCALTGFGQSGPLSRLGSHDLNYLALSGVLAQLKDDSGRPVQPSFQFADMIGGIAAVEGILAALVQRSLTAKGSYLDYAMTDTLVGMMSVHALIYGVSGTGQGVAELSGSTVSYRIYETAEGRYVSLGALEKKFWDNFCRAVGREEWMSEHSSAADAGNPAFVGVTALFKSKTLAEWTKFSSEVDCCMAPVLETGEMTHSPYVEARGLAAETRNKDGVPLRQILTAAGGLRLQGTGGETVQAPALGQHTQEILTDWLGTAPVQLEDWREKGVI